MDDDVDKELEAEFNQWKEAEKERQFTENKLSDKEAINKMTKLVFNHTHLHDLKTAIGEVLDVFMELVETPSKSLKDFKNRLEKVHSSRWQNIQKRYNLVGEDAVDGVPENERSSVTGLVMSFITHVDKCKQAIIEKLEEKHRDVIVMEGKVKHIEERLCQTEDMFLHQKSMYMEKSTQNAGLLATKQHLEELVKEKNKRIEELEKQSNVQVWELEKNRILKETNERIKHLEEELTELKQGREHYKRRMSNIDSSYQKMKMRQKMLAEKAEKSKKSLLYTDELDDSGWASCPLLGINLYITCCSDCSTRKHHMPKLEKKSLSQNEVKEIAYLERELYDLQSNTVGVIGGMKIDISKLGPKLLDEKGVIDKEYEELAARVRKIYTAVLDGGVSKAKEELPAHYRYHQDDTFRVKKMRRLSQPTLPPPRLLHSIMDENKKKDTNSIGVIEGSQDHCDHEDGGQEVHSDLEDDFNVVKSFQTPEAYLTTESTDISMSSEDSYPLEETNISQIQCVNPVIVYPATKKLHAINPLKHFPHMSQQFILDQYEKFQEYDKNGDGSLDLTEVVKVVQYLGITFNAHQLQEAMEEVDRDQNHTLDFYEYLLVIDNIYKRNGKASLFREGLTEIKKKNMSKSCVIQ